MVNEANMAPDRASNAFPGMPPSRVKAPLRAKEGDAQAIDERKHPAKGLMGNHGKGTRAPQGPKAGAEHRHLGSFNTSIACTAS